LPPTTPLIQAPLDRLRYLRELQERKAAQERKRLASLDVFSLLGYEPVCKPRVLAQQRGDDFIPEPCGNCPQERFHAAKESDVLYGGAAGGGKGGRCPDRTAPSYDVSVETKVLTPKGFRLIGDITIGDQVCNPDGTVARVIAVTDNGPKQFYRITLADGSSVEADEDHLWAIAVAGHRRRRRHEPETIPPGLRPEDEWNLRVQVRCRIVNTLQLQELTRQADRERACGNRPHPPMLPLANPLNLTGAKGRWERFSPYVLGALIGDGHFGEKSVSITGEDPEIFARIAAELPPHLELRRAREDGSGRCPLYTIALASRTADATATASFTAELRRLVEARGWSQREFARECGSNQSYVSCLMRGTKRPSRDYTARLDVLLGAEGALLAAHEAHPGVSARDLLGRDGLSGMRSWQKFIPERIKLAPVPDRFAFAQGLFDTDGTMDKRGHVSFTTVSAQLARDAQGVLRSLGYKATITPRQPTYTHNGEKRQGRLAYNIHVRGRHMDLLFHLSRKRERVAKYNGGEVEPFHRVISVEPTDVDNSRCIQVDNLNHLYVTDDYIVTHNSAALVAEGIRACARYPGLRVLLVRRSYDELNESIFPALRKFEFGQAAGGHWNGTERELTFTNKSVFRFRYLESLDDASRRQGGEYQLLLVDELTLMAPGVVDILRYERLRAAGDIPVIGCRCTSNPGGPSHGEVKARYIDATDRGAHVVTDEHGLSVRFIQAKATDNPHLDAAYHSRLAKIPDPARRAAMRDGDWEQFAGMVFVEYRHDRHTLDPIGLPDSWRRYNGIDWGFAAPWAVLWGAVDPDGRVWIYREIYQTRIGETDQALMILAAEAGDERVLIRYADDSMWNLEGDAKPKADVYAENGVHLTKAGKGPGSRITGWQRIHSYMAEMPACPHHRASGWETCPGIHIFRTCRNLLAELRSLPYAKTGNPEDADTKAPDHALDGLRYFLVNLGTGPEFVILGDTPKALLDGMEIPEQVGNFGIRRDETDEMFAAAALARNGSDQAHGVQRSPFA